MSKITQAVTELATPVLEDLDVELWDVEFTSHGGEQYLRIFIDKASGVTIDDCELVSKTLDPLLDEADLIKTGYMLEVSSAGVERTLKKSEHFVRYIGSLIEVKLFKAVEGSKKYSGTLIEYDSEHLVIDLDGSPLSIPLENLSRANLKFVW